jgi:hypothetical protein
MSEYKIYQPPPAQFKLQLVKGSTLVFNLPEGPNAFHRWMQRIFLGFVWEKL